MDPNLLNDLADPKERKFIKKFGLQNYRNWLISKCGPNISNINSNLIF